MCNLYSMTRNQEAIRRLFKIYLDIIGNMPSFPSIYPDAMAPIVRVARDGNRQLEMMRWGFPPPPNLGNRPVTNVRNVKSPYWRGWLKPEFRCLVPATSFCEWTDSSPKVQTWFALTGDEPRPIFAFAGIWRPWTGIRGTKAAPVEGEHLLFSFLTTEPNEIVRPVHSKAMPVILRAHEWDAWLSAPTDEALALQRPLQAAELRVCLTGAKTDPAE